MRAHFLFQPQMRRWRADLPWCAHRHEILKAGPKSMRVRSRPSQLNPPIYPLTRCGLRFFALAARANFAEKLPRVNPQIVIIVPRELDRIFADALCRQRLRRRLENEQGAGGGRGWISGAASGVAALFLAHGAGTGIAQVNETVVRSVAVSPLDVHAGSAREMNFYGLGVGGSCGGLKRRLHEISIA